MKKLFLFLIIFVGTLMFSPTVLSQTEIQSAEDTFKNMVNCGKLNQACCDISKVQIPVLGLKDLPSPFNVITTPMNAILGWGTESVTKGVEAIRNLVFNTFGITEKLICNENLIPNKSFDINNNSTCSCIDVKVKNISRLCSMVSNKEQSTCLSCVTDRKGIWTSLGCVESNISQFISMIILNWGIGLGGGFSLLCIIYAAFMMQSSQGNPEKLKKAQEMITSCIMGLMLIIFSVFILRLIGVNILRIQGFT